MSENNYSEIESAHSDFFGHSVNFQAPTQKPCSQPVRLDFANMKHDPETTWLISSLTC